MFAVRHFKSALPRKQMARALAHVRFRPNSQATRQVGSQSCPGSPRIRRLACDRTAPQLVAAGQGANS